MKSVYESIMTGLTEAVEDAKASEKKLKRRVVTIVPVKEYTAKEVQNIRHSTGFSQKLFASYMGVSAKTVEAWEAGINHPSGAAVREIHSHDSDGQFSGTCLGLLRLVCMAVFPDTPSGRNTPRYSR